MADRLTIEAAIAQIERCAHPSLIAIDGLPCSGKSMMAERLGERLEMECVQLDVFVLRSEIGRQKTDLPFLSSISDMRRS